MWWHRLIEVLDRYLPLPGRAQRMRRRASQRRAIQEAFAPFGVPLSPPPDSIRPIPVLLVRAFGPPEIDSRARLLSALIRDVHSHGCDVMSVQGSVIVAVPAGASVRAYDPARAALVIEKTLATLLGRRAEIAVSLFLVHGLTTFVGYENRKTHVIMSEKLDAELDLMASTKPGNVSIQSPLLDGLSGELRERCRVTAGVLH